MERAETSTMRYKLVFGRHVIGKHRGFDAASNSKRRRDERSAMDRQSGVIIFGRCYVLGSPNSDPDSSSRMRKVGSSAEESLLPGDSNRFVHGTLLPRRTPPGHKTITPRQSTFTSKKIFDPEGLASSSRHGDHDDTDVTPEAGPYNGVIHVCTSDGGTFSYSESDAKIFVPAGAVSGCESLKFCQRTICNVNSYREDFHLKKDQVFVSPIMDLSCSTGFSGFKKKVSISLPICENICARNIQVYCQIDANVVTIPPLELKTDQEMFHVVQKHAVIIYTLHFSKYFSCVADSEGKYFGLNAYVFARNDGQSCDVRLFLCDELHSLPDFVYELEQREEKSEFRLIHHHKVNLLDEVRDEDEISVSFHSESWQLLVSPVTQNHMDRSQNFAVSEIISSNALDNPAVHTWTVIPVTDVDHNTSMIYVTHTTRTVGDAQNGVQRKETSVHLQRRLNQDSGEHSTNPRRRPPPTSQRLPLNSTTEHNELLAFIDRNVPEDGTLYRQVQIQSRTYISQSDVSRSNTVYDILACMERGNHIGIGKYESLKRIFEQAGAKHLNKEIERRESSIMECLGEEERICPSKRQKWNATYQLRNVGTDTTSIH